MHTNPYVLGKYFYLPQNSIASFTFNGIQNVKRLMSLRRRQGSLKCTFNLYLQSLCWVWLPQSTDLNLFGIATICYQTSDWRWTCQRAQMRIRKEKVKQDECEWSPKSQLKTSLFPYKMNTQYSKFCKPVRFVVKCNCIHSKRYHPVNWWKSSLVGLRLACTKS